MGFVTPALLGGALLVGVPILLHLIMRREAQHLLFPALRFVQRRKSLNQHRLRLRHWLLLALRCAVIALLAFALARPVLRGTDAAAHEGAPVATALVFDNSLRMEYQHENRSRLDHAKELAIWLLAQLPPDSPVTVVDRGGAERGSGEGGRDAAELRVERLTTSAATRPLQEALRDAAEWLTDQKDHRGEIYVFTDLGAESWTEETLESLKSRLDGLVGTNVYLIDVGVERARNMGLAPLRLSSERITPGGMLSIHTELLSTAPNGAASDRARDAASAAPANDAGATGAPEANLPDTNASADASGASDATGDVVVELYLSDSGGEPVKRGQQVVSPRDDRPIPIEFALSGLSLGPRQGYLRIVGSDPLSADDIRYFSVDVAAPSKVLLLGETLADTLFLHEALAPRSPAGLTQARFDCTALTFAGAKDLSLADYQAVCLLDPPPLSAQQWQAIADFAQAGGGVGVFLGRRARRDAFNESAPQSVLPAKLRWVARDATYLRPVAIEHPALAELRDFADAVPWSEFPVFKYWELEPGDGSAHTIASFANDKPAILERLLGDGRVLMMTTSISDPAHHDPWNLLPTGPDPWPFLVLANSVADYLTGTGGVELNYVAGQAVVMRLAPEEQTTSYVLQMPGTAALRQTLTPGQRDLAITSTETPGNYRIRAGGQSGALDRGFSINIPGGTSNLSRADSDHMIEVLGDERVRIARNEKEIEVRVGLGRVGRELFPILILAVALILGAEQLLANRFYRDAGGASEGRLAGVH